jgi:D-alanyl-D-alanine carboxypeptidase
VATRTLGIVTILACSVGIMGASPTALRPFDPVAFQGAVEATAKELLLPGAMVLLRTPQGEFAFGYGSTELGVTSPPRADTHFRVASNTKNFDQVALRASPAPRSSVQPSANSGIPHGPVCHFWPART